MKKIVYTFLTLVVVVGLSACSQKEEGKKTSEKDSLKYALDMSSLSEEAKKEEAKKAPAQEKQLPKENINNSIKENNMNENAQTLGDNSSLVKKYPSARIKTNQGDMEVKFNGEETPVTVGNFLKLSQEGFYSGTKFHRVIKGFMIQGGDSLSKDEALKDRWGTGGPGYSFNDELKGTEKYPQGTLAMANSGPDTNGSQFFIVTADPEAPLPASYTVFGEVTKGIEVALEIENVKTGESDRPVEDVVIESVEALEK